VATRNVTIGFGLTAHPPIQEHIALLRHIDGAGYSHIWVPDERFTRDMAVELTVAALQTKRVAIGTAITNTYTRHPVSLAALAASVDEIAGGRLVLGLSAGSSGLPALGLSRVRPVRRLREAIGVMRDLWKGERVTFRGEVLQVEGASLDLTPVRAEIPVWIAARGPRLLQLAGEIADGVLIGSLASPAVLRYAHDRIDRGLRAAGRQAGSLERGIWLHTAIADDEDEAHDAVRTIVTRLLLSTAPVLRRFGVTLPPALADLVAVEAHDPRDARIPRIREALTPDVLQHFSVSGTPKQVRARVEAIVATGVTHLAINPYPGRRPMTEFADVLRATLDGIVAS
jgi:5,10-methylenetetrahydromethanopterin reductase